MSAHFSLKSALIQTVMFVVLGVGISFLVKTIPVTTEATSIQLADSNVQQSVSIITPTSSVSIRWATPEMRVGEPETNDDIRFFLTVRSNGTVLETTPIIASTTAAGTYGLIALNAPPRAYDIGIKGHQHLTKVLRNVPISEIPRVLNFTQSDNSAPKGPEVLTAGDINGDGLTPATLGDDKVNVLDITSLLQEFDSREKYARANLNQDGKVNALDLTTILKNFNKLGEK